MISAACLTLAVVHGLVWWFDRRKRDRLAFAVLTLANAAMALVEIPMMKSSAPDHFATALRWQHVPVLVIFVAAVCFVRLHLQAGRAWLGWLAVGMRAVSLVLDFTVGQNLNYMEVTAMREARFLGDSVWMPEGIRNPSQLAGQLALLLLVCFVVDASWKVWRRGDRRKALLAGGSIVLFVLCGSAQAALSHWHLIAVPAVAGHWFTGLIILMALELSFDALRAAKLAEELRLTKEREQREVAHLGRVAALGDMSASLAHELNQPLGSILTNAQAAQRLLERGQPGLDELREILDDIISEDLRASAVIQRMRAMLKRSDVDFQPVSLHDIAREVVPLVRNLLGSRQVQLTLEGEPGLPLVSGDRVQLQQVLLNLVLNACDAMQETPRGTRRLHISTASNGADVELSVTDSGCGLPDDVERLFLPFHTTKENGLGMGLAICRSIANAHHGRLRAARNPAGGAVFRLTLPRLPDEHRSLHRPCG